MVEEDVRSMQINELIKSINQLTTVYRELNDLVINQGSLIDRIDFNI
jgi:t-SNARE complex subunit (syntaxin)